MKAGFRVARGSVVRRAAASRRVTIVGCVVGALLAVVGSLLAPLPAQAAPFMLHRSVEIRGFKGMCLDVRGAGTADGTLVQMWGCMNVPQQQWTIWSDGTIRADHSGQCLTLDLNISGRQLMMRPCSGINGQKWSTLNLPTSPAIGARIFHSSGRCLSVRLPDISYSTPAQIEDCGANFDSQIFVVVRNQYAGPNSARLFFHQRWFEATRDEAMCFSPSSCARRDHLWDVRAELLARHAPSYELNHPDVGGLLNRLAAKGAAFYSTTDKVYIWNSIANQSSGVKINELWAQNPVVDSFDFRNTRKHTVVPFWDGYHGPLTDYSLQDAFNMIWQHELDFPGPLVNHGDAEASTRTVISLQRFQATNDFSQFAIYWNRLMQRRDGVVWCADARIYEVRCAAIGIGPLR